MPTNLLLLPLLAGYWFIRYCHFFKFRAQKLDGYRLLIHSASVGVVFLGVSRLLTWSVLYWQQKYFVVGLIARTWNDITPEPYAGSAVLSFLIGIVAPFAVNRFISRQTAKDWALKGSTDDLAKLLHSAMKRELPVSIGLDTSTSST